MIKTTTNKAYCIKHKVIGHNPTVLQNHHQKAEWMPHLNKIKMQNIRNRKKKTSKRRRLYFKSWSKTKTRSCEWIHFWPGERKHSGRTSTNIKPKLLSTAKNFHQKKVKSAQKRKTEPLHFVIRNRFQKTQSWHKKLTVWIMIANNSEFKKINMIRSQYIISSKTSVKKYTEAPHCKTCWQQKLKDFAKTKKNRTSKTHLAT